MSMALLYAWSIYKNMRAPPEAQSVSPEAIHDHCSPNWPRASQSRSTIAVPPNIYAAATSADGLHIVRPGPDWSSDARA